MKELKIVTRKEAFKKVLKKYYTGIPCKNGHLAEKHTKSGACVECMKEGKKKSLDALQSKFDEKFKD